MIRYKGQLKTQDFNIEKKRIYKKGQKTKYILKCYDIFTFDIETTSAWIDENGNVIGYEKGHPEEYWNNLEPLALCYIWQFSVNEVVYYGRTLEEFKALLYDFPENFQCKIFIHNLPFEFAWLVNILHFDKVFARTPHKPIKASCVEFPLIEFCCTYALENTSLENWGKDLGLPKMVGDLDYLKVRTPFTQLTDTEMKYCERDCEVVYAGIKKELETYGDVYNIPMTSTGKIRRVVKDLLTKDPVYAKYIKTLVPSVDIYKLLQTLFSGGYTHPSRLYAGRDISGLIEHYDFCSSYPTCMLAFKYPSTPWVYRTNKNMPTDVTFEKYAFIFRLKFKNIRAKNVNTYIQKCKCTGHGFINDNGRVIAADDLEIICNEIDWMIIKKTYDFECVYLLDSWYSKKDYLPKAFILYILKLYNEKTQYKGIEEKEDEYRRAKAFLNSLYGLMVSAVIYSDCVYTKEDEWYIKPLTSDEVKKRLAALKNPKYKHDHRYFLNYSAGCWVTSYGRKILWDCMLKCPNDILYVDTDSIFAIGQHDFSDYNNWIVQKLYDMCDHYGIDKELLAPKDKKGKAHMLGLFEKEHDLCEYKTLHAKCYCMRETPDEDGKRKPLQITISGINKGAAEMLDDDIDNFAPGFSFDKDHKSVTKNLHVYINDMPSVKYPDGYISNYRSGLNLRKCGYKLGQTDEYKKVLEFSQMHSDDISIITLRQLRGYFNNE